MKVKDIMSKKVICCAATDAAQHAAQLMKTHNVGCVPVTEYQTTRKLVGAVTDRDLCIRLVCEGLTAATPVSSVMTRKLVTCRAEDTLDACEALMQKHQLRRIPIVDTHGDCIGIVSQADIALHHDARHIQQMLGAISRPHHFHTAPVAFA